MYLTGRSKCLYPHRPTCLHASHVRRRFIRAYTPCKMYQLTLLASRPEHLSNMGVRRLDRLRNDCDLRLEISGRGSEELQDDRQERHEAQQPETEDEG